MKVLVLNGSPRREKSNTLKMTNAFLNGIKTKDPSAEIQLFHAQDLHIKFCEGCLHCLYDGECVLRDDMDMILPLILSSDVVVFSFPLYAYGMSAVLKRIIERMLALCYLEFRLVQDHYEHLYRKDFSNIRFVMVSSSGFPSVEGNFDMAVKQFETFFHRNTTAFTIPEGPLFDYVEYPEFTEPVMKRMEQAGMEFAETGSVSADLLQRIKIPAFPERLYTKWLNYGMYLYRKEKEPHD